MLVSSLLVPFTRRRFLQTSAATCAFPSLPGSAVTQAFTVPAIAKSIEQLGLAIFHCDRNRDTELLLGGISSRSVTGTYIIRILALHPNVGDYTNARSALFGYGNDIMTFLNKGGDDISHFLEAIPPEDILKASEYFNLPTKFVSWNGEKFGYSNPKLNENANQFAQNPEVRRYIEAGNYRLGELGKVSTTELGKMLFDDLRCRVSLLYKSHLNIAKFLHLIEHRRDISVKNGRTILKFFGEKYAPFRDIATRELNSQFKLDAQEKIGRQEEAKLKERLGRQNLEADKRLNFLTPKDRETLAGLHRTAIGRFIRGDIDGQTLGELCFDLDLELRHQPFLYTTAAQIAIEIGITNVYENYENEL